MVPDTEIEGLRLPAKVALLPYQNIGKTRIASLSGYINWNVRSNTRIYANIYGNYSYMEGANGLKNDGLESFTPTGCCNKPCPMTGASV